MLRIAIIIPGAARRHKRLTPNCPELSRGEPWRMESGGGPRASTACTGGGCRAPDVLSSKRGGVLRMHRLDDSNHRGASQIHS